MARAYPSSPQQDYEPEPQGDLQALRGELEALLEQVESQVARTRREDEGYQSISERMQDIRQQMSEPEPDTRHREALRSVKRAVDRFQDRDDAYVTQQAPQRRDGFPPNPRDTLQSAIAQIRARHSELASDRPAPAPAQQFRQPIQEPVREVMREFLPRMMDSPRFDELAHAVSGISGRLERLENELRMHAKGQTGNVKEIAEQVAQLSHVVELLAGAVGETGQVKRLESQIAGIAKLVAQGPQIDLSSLTKRLDELGSTVGKLFDRQDTAAGAQKQENSQLAQRLDDVTATMGRLADLQVQFANRVEANANATVGLKDGMRAVDTHVRDGIGAVHSDLKAGIGSVHDGIKDSASALEMSLSGGIKESTEALTARLAEGMTAIEESVRNIYDRIDTIEKHTALPPIDVDKLTDEMAKITEAMRNPAQPQGLIELVDELNSRIAGIESSHGDVGGLKSDVEALRTAVVDAVEPRFAALEMQIEALSDRVASHPSADISVGQLEAQVRQLVARMDQTGETLTGLAKLYNNPVEREPAPDFEALADMVAARTSEAVAQNAPLTVSGSGLSESGIDELERRLSRLVTAASAEKPSDDLNGIEISIREVNDRLARLESSLTARAAEEARIAAMPIVAMMPEVSPQPSAVPSYMAADPIAPLLAEAEAAAVAEAQSEPPTPYFSSMPEARTIEPVRGDAMPTEPSYDAPLVDKPFGDAMPVRAALDAKNGPRKHHPGLSYEPLAGQGADVPPAPAFSERPSFDPNAVDRPPRPSSAFDAPEREAFVEVTPPPAAIIAEPDPAPQSEEPPPPSANTFIAAARRAAQRQAKPEKAKSPAVAALGGSGSLIARAFSNFQLGSKPKPAEGDAPAKAEAPVKAEKPTKPEKPKKEKKGRVLAGDKQSRTEWKPDDEDDEPKGRVRKVQPLPPPPLPVGAGPTAPQVLPTDQEAMAPEVAPKEESFISRHRRPILLVASVVAIVCLTLNLINQRLSEGEPAPAGDPAAPTNTSALDASSTPSPLINQSMATVPAIASGPRVIPMVDSLATASIDPGAAMGFTPSGEMPKMPAAFTSMATDTDGATSTPAVEAIQTASLPQSDEAAPLLDTITEPDAIESPVQVEMPPATLGPEPLRASAAGGDARAQFEIAAIYTEGRAVAEDDAQAAIWYERAAAQDFAPAQYRLGNLYENGRGVKKDLTQAKLWYQRAAEAGNRMAMHNLAALYAGGEMGKQEFDAAARWFQQAAERGMRDSQFNLGMLYARGLGVTQSLDESYKWFSLAALKGDADAGKARDDIARSLDAATVAKLNSQVAAFTPTAIDLVANFAPLGTWSAAFDPGETITNRDVVKSVQQALTSLGYEVGTPDGLAGPRTGVAIKAFEKATGMTEVGAVNPRLLAVLGSQPV